MTRAEYDHLLATVTRMAEMADILSRSMALFARSEKDPQRHATQDRVGGKCKQRKCRRECNSIHASA